MWPQPKAPQRADSFTIYTMVKDSSNQYILWHINIYCDREKEVKVKVKRDEKKWGGVGNEREREEAVEANERERWNEIK